MSNNPTPRGKRVACGLLAVTFAITAAFTAKEIITGPKGPLSDRLGMAFNKVMLGASKLGMGIGEIHREFSVERKAKEEAAPEGMQSLASAAVFEAEVPAGVRVKGKDTSFVAEQAKELAKASHRAFISASKVEIYAK